MSVTIVATVEATNMPPRVRLHIESTAPTPAAATINLRRTHADGSALRVILPRGSQTVGGQADVYDYHAPINETVSYTVQLGSDSGSSQQVTLPASVSWLMHPVNPARSTPIDAVMSFGDRTFASTAAGHRPFGARRAIFIDEGVRRDATGDVVVRVDSRQQEMDVLSCLSDSGPILLNLAKHPGWWDVAYAWVQPGDVSAAARPTLDYPYRHITIPIEIIDQPAVAAMAQWTYGAATATGRTYAQRSATYATYADATTDTRSA